MLAQSIDVSIFEDEDSSKADKNKKASGDDVEDLDDELPDGEASDKKATSKKGAGACARSKVLCNERACFEVFFGVHVEPLVGPWS